MGTDIRVRVDIPCDVPQVDPVLARVVGLNAERARTVVHLEILPGDPIDYAAALSRAHLLSA